MIRLRLRCLAFLMAAFGMASAHAVPSDVDRLTDSVVKLMPFGQIFDMMAARNDKWPMQDKPEAVSAAQLACLRGELSTPGYRRLRRAQVADYAKAHPDWVKRDIRVLEAGAAELFGSTIMAGARGEMGGPTPDPDAIMSGASEAAQASLMTLISDPDFAELRKISGLGSMFDQLGPKEEMEAKGEKQGADLATNLMLGAISTCKIPTSALY